MIIWPSTRASFGESLTYQMEGQTLPKMFLRNARHWEGTPADQPAYRKHETLGHDAEALDNFHIISET